MKRLCNITIKEEKIEKRASEREREEEGNNQSKTTTKTTRTATKQYIIRTRNDTAIEKEKKKNERRKKKRKKINVVDCLYISFNSIQIQSHLFTSSAFYKILKLIFIFINNGETSEKKKRIYLV